MSLTFSSSSFRSTSLAPVLLLLLACGAVSGEPDTVTDAVSPAHGSVQVTLQDISFTACLCHHGFGPGINGGAQLHVMNSGTNPVTLMPGAFVLRNQSSGKAYTTYSEVTGFGYYNVVNIPAVVGNPGSPPSFDAVVAPGASTDITVTFYIDGVTWPVAASPYELEVDLGAGMTATSKTFALTESS